jgi:hypothetical protein
MADTKKLHAIDIKNEVKRIKKLPKEEQEAQMDILHDKIKTEIDAYYDKMDTMTLSEKKSEDIRLTKCISVFRWKWEKTLWEYRHDKNKERSEILRREKDININASRYTMKKANTAHVSGLPLPEQAEVDIWWQEDRLIFASASTEFSLPVERVTGIGTTREYVGSDFGNNPRTYLTIEYKKEDEMKYIVVRVNLKFEVEPLIRYFDQIKGTREIQKQEL